MPLKQKVSDDLQRAMKAQDRGRLATLRMVKSKMQERELDLRAEHGRDYELDDNEAVAVFVQAAKQRRDSIESFRGAGREDLATKEEAELSIIEEYLPKQMGEDEIRDAVKEAIAECGATTPRDMGKVMKILMPKVKGKADGKVVNRVVKQMLEA